MATTEQYKRIFDEALAGIAWQSSHEMLAWGCEHHPYLMLQTERGIEAIGEAAKREVTIEAFTEIVRNQWWKHHKQLIKLYKEQHGDNLQTILP